MGKVSIVEMGNVAGRTPDGAPSVFRMTGLDDLTFEDGGDVNNFMRHLLTHVGSITKLPDHEAFVSVVRNWDEHSDVPPTWVTSDNPEMERVLSEFYGCPIGKPADVEDTHHTLSGPPGVGPEEVTPDEG